jgi:hypothetical protein
MICPLMSRPVIESGATKLLEVECQEDQCKWFWLDSSLCCIKQLTSNIHDLAEYVTHKNTKDW